MCKQQTGWFLHLGGKRTADGKKDYVRTDDGRRFVFDDDEAQAALTAKRLTYPSAHLRPAYGPTPTLRNVDPCGNAIKPDDPDYVAPLDATPNLLGQGVNPDAIPANPGDVTDEMYDRFSADQRVHYHRMMITRPSEWTPYPA